MQIDWLINEFGPKDSLRQVDEDKAEEKWMRIKPERSG